VRDGDASDGWWRRNWGWCCGCGCSVPILVILALVVGTPWLARQLFDSNDALFTAMEIVNEDPRAIEALGEPIEARLWRDNTSFNFKGRGRLRAEFTVAGPKGEGRLALEAHEAGAADDAPWRIDRLVLHVDDQDVPIDLLEQPGP
jgi:hypothetical protein